MIFAPALLVGVVGMLGLGSLGDVFETPPMAWLGLTPWEPLLPAPPHPGRLVLGALMLTWPAVLARWDAREALRRCLGEGLSVTWLRRRLRLQDGSVPAAAILAGLVAGMETWVPWLTDSLGLQALVLLTPLVLAEVGVRIPQAWLDRRLERLTHERILRLGWRRAFTAPILLVLPIVLTGLLDLATLSRPLEVGMGWTTWGQCVLVLGGVVSASVVMPWLFRLLLPLKRRFPGPFEGVVHAAAAALGFPRRKLFYLPSGFSVVNAFLVGPVRFGRFMAISDGLIHMLPQESLPGVIAHEVGHARSGHILLWAAVLASVLLWLGIQPLGEPTMGEDWLGSLGFLGAVLGAIWLVRKLAHRFELEADAWSAAALGDPQPILTALGTVASTHPASADRDGLLHPSDRARMEHLQALQEDPGHRLRFERSGRRLRMLIALLLAVSLGAAAWRSVAAWPDERLDWLYWNGRMATLGQALEGVSTDPDSPWESQQRAAAAAVPEDAPWHLIRDRLADAGWRIGIEALDGASLDSAAWTRAVTHLGLVRHRGELRPEEFGAWRLVAALADGDTNAVDDWRGWLRREHLGRLPSAVQQLLQ